MKRWIDMTDLELKIRLSEVNKWDYKIKPNIVYRKFLCDIFEV